MLIGFMRGVDGAVDFVSRNVQEAGRVIHSRGFQQSEGSAEVGFEHGFGR